MSPWCRHGGLKKKVRILSTYLYIAEILNFNNSLRYFTMQPLVNFSVAASISVTPCLITESCTYVTTFQRVTNVQADALLQSISLMKNLSTDDAVQQFHIGKHELVSFFRLLNPGKFNSSSSIITYMSHEAFSKEIPSSFSYCWEFNFQNAI